MSNCESLSQKFYLTAIGPQLLDQPKKYFAVFVVADFSSTKSCGPSGWVMQSTTPL